MHSQAMYRYRPRAARDDRKLAKADEIDCTMAPQVARAMGSQALFALMVSARF